MPLEIAFGHQRRTFLKAPQVMHSSKHFPSPTVFLCFCKEHPKKGKRKKKTLPTVKNAIHKKQASYIFHCLCERAKRSPVEENRMTACELSAWWRRQIVSAAINCVRSLWRQNRSPEMSCRCCRAAWSLSETHRFHKQMKKRGWGRTHITSSGLARYT